MPLSTEEVNIPLNACFKSLALFILRSKFNDLAILSNAWNYSKEGKDVTGGCNLPHHSLDIMWMLTLADV